VLELGFVEPPFVGPIGSGLDWANAEVARPAAKIAATIIGLRIGTSFLSSFFVWVTWAKPIGKSVVPKFLSTKARIFVSCQTLAGVA
jgi:hypothetical protein